MARIHSTTSNLNLASSATNTPSRVKEVMVQQSSKPPAECDIGRKVACAAPPNHISHVLPSATVHSSTEIILAKGLSLHALSFMRLAFKIDSKGIERL
jgi:hypothetical protein